MPLDPYHHVRYASLQEMSGQFPPVDWLWPSWIPRGMLTLLGAAPGVGKSLVALDLARRIIHGQPFPDGAPVSCPGSNVLIVDAEGAPALLNQRAQAWDIDTSRFYLMLSPDRTGFIDLSQGPQLILLGRMIGNIRPSLVIVDSLAAATSRGESSLQGARNILGALTGMARTGNIAILVIHHLRKRARSGSATTSPKVAADDLRGSSHLSAAARSVIALSICPPHPEPTLRLSQDLNGLAQSPSEESSRVHVGPPEGLAKDSPSAPTIPSTTLSATRRLEVVKTNLCLHPPPLALRLEGDGLAVPTLHYSQ